MLHQPADQFQPSASPTCPVAALASAFQRHVDLHNAIDGRSDRAERRGATGSDAHAAEQIHDAVASAAPFMQAFSAEGALFQIIYASGRASAMYDIFPEGDDYAGATEYMREVEAALTSARRFIESHFAIDGRRLGGDYYAADYAALVPRLEKACRELLPAALPIYGARAPSRIPELARQYERWLSAYRQAGVLQESDDDAVKERGDCATGHAVRHMHELLTELQIVRSRNLGDVALKARIVREFQADDWYGAGADADLDRGEKLARVIIDELLDMGGLTPLAVPDFEPAEILHGYVEPDAVFLQAAE